MNPVNCKVIELDVKLSYTRVTTGITCPLESSPEEAAVAALGRTPTYSATQRTDDRKALGAQLWACKKFW